MWPVVDPAGASMGGGAGGERANKVKLECDTCSVGRVVSAKSITPLMTDLPYLRDI